MGVYSFSLGINFVGAVINRKRSGGSPRRGPGGYSAGAGGRANGGDNRRGTSNLLDRRTRAGAKATKGRQGRRGPMPWDRAWPGGIIRASFCGRPSARAFYARGLRIFTKRPTTPQGGGCRGFSGSNRVLRPAEGDGYWGKRKFRGDTTNKTVVVSGCILPSGTRARPPRQGRPKNSAFGRGSRRHLGGTPASGGAPRPLHP